jgi:membrane protein DedA with SNARE-associated domain
VISFFAGMSMLNVKKTIILSTVSAFFWNAIIIYLGYIFGSNVAVVDEYLSTYTNIAVAAALIIVLIIIIKFVISKKKNKS